MQLEGLGERCKLPPVESPSRQAIGAYWSQKVQLWWQQFLLKQRKKL